MPVPDTHYRVALGEYRRRHSWIVQSNIGLIWMNLHDDLSSLLEGLLPSNVLDFSLGSGGSFYIKYLADGQEKRKLSRRLWEEISQNPNVELDRLTLGPRGQHWGVRVDRDGRRRIFERVDRSGAFGRRLGSRIRGVDSFDEINFVTLGARGDWAFGVNGHVDYQGTKLFRKCVTDGQSMGKTILSVTMSPLDACWFVCWDDGTISFNLPEDMNDDVDAHCQLQHSMMTTYIASPGFGEIALPVGDVPTDSAPQAKHWRVNLPRKRTIAAVLVLVLVLVIVIGIIVFAVKRHRV